MDCLWEAAAKVDSLLAYAAIMIALYPWVGRYSAETWTFSRSLRLLASHLVWVPIASLLTLVLLVTFVWLGCKGLFAASLVLITIATILAFVCLVPILLCLNFASVRNWFLLRSIGTD